VTDKQAATRTISLGTLTVSAGNRAPVVSYAYTSVGTQVRLNRDGTLPAIDLGAYAYDPDGDSLTLGWSWLCDGSCSASGTLGSATANDTTFTGSAAAGEVLTFTYTATDSPSDASTPLSASRSIDVTVLAASNQTPYFTSASQSATTVNQVPSDVTFTVAATDGDGDTLSYTWAVDGVVDGTATGASYTLTVPASATDGQSFVVSVTVDDGYVTTPPKRSFTVTYTNTPPRFTDVSQSATDVSSVPATVNFTAVAVDDDGDGLTYAWSVDGVEDTAATGSSYALSLAGDAPEGSYTVTVEVTDGRDTVSHAFVVTYSQVSSDTGVILR
jgi:hypothetical protein